MKSWIEVPADSHFPIQNIPFGIYTLPENPAWGSRACVAIGEYILDLHELNNAGYFENHAIKQSDFLSHSYNCFLDNANFAWREVRRSLMNWLCVGENRLQKDTALLKRALHHQSTVQMQLPIQVRDYTDFYSSLDHATNVGIMFRGRENALMPNWKHMPIAYHGRASSIIGSGVPLHRPQGQMRPDDSKPPIFGASKQLDFELETAFVLCRPSKQGTPIAADMLRNYAMGMVLFNDWSARDIQKWEYQPLGPFLGKNFASSMSNWIVTFDALEGARIESPIQDPKPLPYLQHNDQYQHYDIELEVEIVPKTGQGKVVSRSNAKHLYWSMGQQLAHHTINGCNVNPCDLMASGTISAPTPDGYGSMLELAWRGEKPIEMPDNSKRIFIEDGDTVIMRGYAKHESGIKIGFGELHTEVLPPAL